MLDRVGSWTVLSAALGLALGCTRGGHASTATAPPAGLGVAAVSPAAGPIGGGTTITVYGTGFSPGAAVVVGGAPATSVGLASASQLTAVTPAGVAGPADVVVANPDGSTATLVGGFRYGVVAVESMADPAATPDLATDGTGGVHVVWQATTSAGRTDIWHARSMDGGATWSATPTNLSASTNPSARPRVAVRGRDVVAVWNETVGSVAAVRASWSVDAGATWSSTQSLASTGRQTPDPAVAFGAGGAAVVAYRVWNPGGIQLVAQRATPGGPLGPTSIIEGGTYDAAGPAAIRADGTGMLRVAYPTAAGATTYRYPDVRWSQSPDGGLTWSTPSVLMNGLASSRGSVAVDCRGPMVVVAWHESWTVIDSMHEWVVARVSFDGGTSWTGPSTLAYEESPWTGWLGGAVAAAVDPRGLVHVAWDAYRPGSGANFEVMGCSSATGGQTWGGVVNVSGSAGQSRAPRLAATAAGVLHVYLDDTVTAGVFDVLVR